MNKASETGHVGITTIHANSVSQVVSRMLGMIPDHLRTQGEIKKVLSLLGIVVFQKLLRRKAVDTSQKRGGRVAVREYLVFTEEVQNYLLDHMDDLTRATQYCVETYGRSYQQHFNQLAEKGVIDVHN
jgi:defect-in-organelle-trafficking protein DotB